MPLKEFKDFFLDNTLRFLWNQWSTLGVAGSLHSHAQRVIDPEALLVTTLKFARYEPRLFDEVLDWLVENARWIDIQRFRGILRQKDENTRRLVSSVACFVSENSGTYKRKWKPLGQMYKPKTTPTNESLFITKDGQPFPEPKNISDIFSQYGFLKEDVNLRRMSKPVAVSTLPNMRFMLRALFGIGSRAECLMYLLTHEAGHPSQIAHEIGISIKGTQDTLVELSESGLVLTRIKGRRKKEYWLSQNLWFEFISGNSYNGALKPMWLNWIALFSALSNLWDALLEAEKAKTEYMRSSKLRQAMETISTEFQQSIPVGNIKTSPEKYEQELRKLLTNIFSEKLHSNI